eukprot:RCo024524
MSCFKCSLSCCDDSGPFWRQVWAANVKAVRANFLPALFVQAIAFVVVLLYFLVPASRAAFDFITDLGTQLGIAFSIMGTSLFGGAIPFAVLLVMRRVPGGLWGGVKEGVFAVVFWAWKGFEFALFYHLQAVVFGEGADLATVASKVATMMFVATPLYFNVENALCFMWKDAGFPGLGRFFRQLTMRALALTCMSSLLSGFLVWIPVYIFVYSLPEPLELPVQNLVLVFWSLLYSTVVKASAVPPAAAEEAYVDVEAQGLPGNEPGKLSGSAPAELPSVPEKAGFETGEVHEESGPVSAVSSPPGVVAGVSPEICSMGPESSRREGSSLGPVSGYAPLVEDKV